MWACGIVLYMLLVGQHPFEKDDLIDDENKSDCTKVEQLIRKIENGDLEIQTLLDSEELEFMSEDAMNLIEQLITVDPSIRLSANQALESNWITETIMSRTPLTKTIRLARMRSQKISLMKEDHFENLKISDLRREMTRNGLELKSLEFKIVKGKSRVVVPKEEGKFVLKM